jgi:spermidine/putrescine transport system substrate-binding protein
MKNAFKYILSLSLISLMITGLASCASSQEDEVTKGEFAGQTLTIYNSEDYISSGDDGSRDLIGEFEKKYGCKVNYYTFDTNETMYNQFTLQKEGTYDLINASEYMIQKLIKEELVQPMDDYATYIPNYEKYCSKELRSKLQNMKVTYQGTEVNLDQFAVGYMWGTLGIIYDPTCSDTIQEDVKSWDVFWNEKYKDLISIKNSMRDTYVVGLMHHYSQDEEFQKIMNEYLANPSEENCAAYNDLIQDIFDFKLDGSETSSAENYQKIANVQEELISLKDNIFGFEVDSGKNDIITGKIKMNLAWSGDAVYSIDTALEESGKVLEYSVPEDGANIWYDGWALPKGANKALAYAFLDFMSSPDAAAANMDYVGYTPFIVGDDIFSLASSYYGAASYDENYAYTYDSEEDFGDHVIYDDQLYMCIKDAPEGTLPTNEEYFTSLEYENGTTYYEGDMVSYQGKIYNCIVEETSASINDTTSFEEVEPYDLSYLFEGSIDSSREASIYPYLGSENQLQTQYPSKEIIARCAIMNDFGTYNDAVIIMWGQVKAYTNMMPIYIFLIVFVVIVLGVIIFFGVRKKLSAKNKRNLKKKLNH